MWMQLHHSVSGEGGGNGDDEYSTSIEQWYKDSDDLLYLGVM
jgi:hypothetical protein